MTKFTGKGVYGAVAMGKISVFKKQDTAIKRIHTEDSEGEKKRVAKAKQAATEQLQSIYDKALREVGETNAQIFEIHMMMLEDDDYNESIENIIDSQKVNAEYAVAVTADNFAEMFASMDDPYMQARAADVKDISNRIIANLTGNVSDGSAGDDKMIVCADDLAPSETISLDKDKVLAFVTAHGSSNSHTAILARNMNIPAVIGVGSKFLSEIKDGDFAIVDGFTGEIFVDPDEKTTAELTAKQKADEEKKRLLQTLKGKENVTKDGKKINIYANIGSLDDLNSALYYGARGIGLLRSEFQYLGRESYPGEEELFQAYKKTAQTMGDRLVVIRTADLGADKQAAYLEIPQETNPLMGNRGIRFCLDRKNLFKTQIRAIYRASWYGNLGMMYPMISEEEEMDAIEELIREVKAELTGEGIPFKNIRTGIMMETPAAVMIGEELARRVDFLGIGTNDLTQYTLAMDRQNPLLQKKYNDHHPAVVRMIKMIIDAGHKENCKVCLCGELAADTRLTETFLRMGVDALSVVPACILPVRKALRAARVKNEDE